MSATREDDDLLSFAAGVAAATGATATGFLAQIDPMEAFAWSADGAFGVAPASVIEAAQQGAAEAWSIARDRAARAGVAVEHIVAAPEIAIPRRAALADLTVFSCACARGRGLLAGVFEEVLMTAGAPVLVQRGPAEALGGVAVIAWNGGGEGARAVRAALPLLKAAAGVVILQAVHDDPAPLYSDPALLKARLARHGVAAEIQTVEPRSGEGRALIDAAKAHGAGLFVAGAYGHSRAREFVFGGASRSFLNATDSPTLLLHH